MKRTVPASVLCALFAASWLSGPSLADPLHKFGNQGAWVHVESGWVFPLAVGSFTRVTQPYSIDGNSDAGVEYRQARGGVLAEVEIYAADSSATVATLDGAKIHAAAKAGKSAHIASEKPFSIDALKDASGVKITYVTDESAGTQTNLYFFTADRWHVKILASVQDLGEDGDLALDAFVQALPWNTLGTNPGLH